MSDAHEPAPPRQAPPYQPPPPRPKRRVGKIVAIVAGAMILTLIVLIGGIFLLVNESTEDAQKVSDDFVAAVQANDGARAYGLTGPAFREATTQAQLSELIGQLSSLVAKDKVSPSGKAINASTESGKIAVFTYALKGNARGNVFFKTQMRDEDDGWKVMNFRSSESPLDTDVE
jgi:hypothetical protein